MKRMATKSRKKTQKTDSDPELFLCLFVIFVAKKLSSVKIFVPSKEIERSSYQRYCVGGSVQTAEVLQKSTDYADDTDQEKNVETGRDRLSS
jgi:hypothetical protein